MLQSADLDLVSRLIPLTQVTATVDLAADSKAAEDESNPWPAQDGRPCLWLSVPVADRPGSGKKRKGVT